MLTETTGRLRLVFAINEPLCYVSVLDMGRVWERLLRRAQIPLVYSQGFNPHPRLQFAAALPVGYWADAELLDILIGAPVDPAAALLALRAQSPSGLCILSVETAPVKSPAPQSTMREAHYVVDLSLPLSEQAIQMAIDDLLARSAIVRERTKKRGKQSEYDLRPLIHDLTLAGLEGSSLRLHMRLRCSSQGSGRPEEILDALHWANSDYTIRRARLVWDAGEEQ